MGRTMKVSGKWAGKTITVTVTRGMSRYTTTATTSKPTKRVPDSRPERPGGQVTGARPSTA
jgi:hypothetical protein